jgi:hypothetical protein
MPRKAAKTNATPATGTAALDASINKVANLLALIAIKDEDEPGKVRALDAAGFNPSEIAALLGKTPNSISVALYKMRNGERRRRKKA